MRKKSIKIKLAIFVSLFISLVSCVREKTVISYSHKIGYGYIDTLVIYSRKHEFIIINRGDYLNGITHSPECWCMKNNW